MILDSVYGNPSYASSQFPLCKFEEGRVKREWDLQFYNPHYTYKTMIRNLGAFYICAILESAAPLLPNLAIAKMHGGFILHSSRGRADIKDRGQSWLTLICNSGRCSAIIWLSRSCLQTSVLYLASSTESVLGRIFGLNTFVRIVLGSIDDLQNAIFGI